MKKSLRAKIAPFTFGVILGGSILFVATGLIEPYTSTMKLNKQLEQTEVNVLNQLVSDLNISDVEIDTSSASGYKTLVTIKNLTKEEEAKFKQTLNERLGNEYAKRISLNGMDLGTSPHSDAD